MKAPFPYFGGKSRVAADVWARIGDVPRYIEPFAGSLAVLLARPEPWSGREIVNDSDGLLVNAWRGMAKDPEAVAEHADWPATEPDLHARHAWLVGQREDITRRLEGDPGWFDAKAAAWWLWGIGLWIGGGWCSGTGPWRVVEVDSNDGRGIHRQLLHAGNDGQGIHRQLLHAGDDGQGDARVVGWRRDRLLAAFQPIAERLRDALVMCGDWSRVVTPAVMHGSGKGRGAGVSAGVFLDPPYGLGERVGGLYAHDAKDVTRDVEAWCRQYGDDDRLRIALCGYEGEYDLPGWSVLHWKSKGGYSGQSEASSRARANSRRERVWFSPHCHRAGLWEVPA
jgi:DNA adenine methylase